MQAAADWVNGLRKVGRPVFLAAPAVWDGMFVHWYFVNFVGRSPFGATGSGVDLRRYWMGKTGWEWGETRKGGIKRALRLSGLPHTHHAGKTPPNSPPSLRRCWKKVSGSGRGGGALTGC